MSDQPKYIPNDPDRFRLEHEFPFDPDKLLKNEVVMREGLILAKIPKIEGRIVFREGDEPGKRKRRYVQLITERSYDPEKKQCRNKKVMIGTDLSRIYNGMMAINENYHKYFDTDGKLVNDPMQERQERKNETAEAQGSEAGEDAMKPETPQPAKEEEEKEEPESDEEREAREEQIIQESVQRVIEEINQKRQPEKKAKTGTTVSAGDGAPELPTIEELRQQVKAQEKAYLETGVRERVQLSKAEKDTLEMLREILNSYYYLMEEMARKKHLVQMTPAQVGQIDEILRSLQPLLQNGLGCNLLRLGEEVQEDRRITYEEMFFILVPYKHMAYELVYGDLWNVFFSEPSGIRELLDEDTLHGMDRKDLMELKKAYRKETDNLMTLAQMNEDKAEKDYLDFLRNALSDYKDHIEHIAKRKPEEPVSSAVIEMINALLKDVREMLERHEEARYLKPAAETSSYGEMMLTLAPYRSFDWKSAYREILRSMKKSGT